jgi:hypothetical protein
MSHDPQSPTDAADHDGRPFCAWIGGTCTGLRDCCDDRPPGYDDDNEYDVDDEEDEFECGAWLGMPRKRSREGATPMANSNRPMR